MPRYFFDTYDSELFLDDIGTVLPDLHAAKCEAAEALATMAKDALPLGTHQRTLMIKIRDHDGNVLLQVRLSFAAELPIGSSLDAA